MFRTLGFSILGAYTVILYKNNFLSSTKVNNIDY